MFHVDMFDYSEIAPLGTHRGTRRAIRPRGRHLGARHINVPGDSPTILDAIEDAHEGDTIHVGPQTYSEQITIEKDLTLIGAGANSTIIQSPSDLSTDSFGKKFIVEIIKGAIVDMSGFTITGPDGSPQWGIGVFDGSTLEFRHATVRRIRESPNLHGGTGILVGHPSGAVGNAVISHVVVSEYSNHGICVMGNGSTADISENEVIGYGPTPELNQVGIMVGFGARATVTQNHKSSENMCNHDECGSDPINEGQSVGIFTYEADPDTVISGNRVGNNDVGIYLYSSTGLNQTNDNILRNNRYFGLVVQDGDNTCSGNNITGGNVGIGVVAGGRDTFATLRNNRIDSARSVEGISAGGYSARYSTA